MAESGMEAYDLSRLAVVVVDDNIFMLKVMKAILRALAIRNIRCLDNPTDVFPSLDAQPAHLLITDILMRPIDGIELTKTIRSLGGDIVPYTPILALSGLTDRHHVLGAVDAGVHEVLTKPISPRRLYSSIERMIAHPVDFVRSDTYFGPARRSAQSIPPSIEQPQPGDEDVVYF